jgi:hypothetical protein
MEVLQLDMCCLSYAQAWKEVFNLGNSDVQTIQYGWFFWPFLGTSKASAKVRVYS